MKYKIIVDKQNRNNPTEEKREYEVDIAELHFRGDIYDSLVITKDEDYVIRRLEKNEYNALNVLKEEVKEPLPDLNIELFEGDNYIYLLDSEGNKLCAEYLIKNDFTDTYVMRSEMNSAINETVDKIELTVNQKLIEYATTEDLTNATTELNSSITQTAGEIKEEVSKTYATNEDLAEERSQRTQKENEITQTVGKKVGNDEIISKINQSAEQVQINAQKISLER